MSGFLFLFLFLLFGFCSYFRFHVRSRLGSPKKLDTATNQQEEEADQSEGDVNYSEASVSEYQVFLNFRGPDSRQGLADVLYSDMTSVGIRAFRDDDELEDGDQIGKILLALENSQICVPIFSRTFAASAWCLREVERMVELGKKIVPIFYTATPDDVKLRTGLFEKDLRKHEKRYGREQVKKWEDALKAVGRIKGREVKNTRFTEFSKLFVRALLIKLKVNKKYVTDCLVEINDQQQAVMELLDIEANDVRLVGIHGMGGVGKTTLAKVIFNQLSTVFDRCSFLQNIQESLRCNGPDNLLRQLLEELDPKLKYFQPLDYVKILRENFYNQKVLIVLDDVKNREEVELVVRAMGWFGSRSRIIITTRDIRVFTKDTRTFEMQEMKKGQALQLFSRHAFGADSPPSDYRILTNEVLSLAGRLPLALEVIGSRLYRCEKKVWTTTIEKLKKIPDQHIEDKLKISFDALEYEQKQIFLDIACFFIDMERSNAVYMWEACDFFPDDGIEVLVSMSLVKIKYGNKFWMHDLIRDLGRQLVREECMIDPGKRSRVWSHKEALQVLKIKQGKKKVEGLFLEKLGDANLTNEEFSSFRYLRLLKLIGVKLSGNFQNLLPKLLWLSWHQCPADFTVTNLSLENLVVLNLSQTSINENWVGWSSIQMAKNLKVLNLTRCFNLTSTPDLSNNSALEKLIIRGCCSLAEIHISICKLKRLKLLDIEGCYSLRKLPEELGSLVDLEEILVEGNGNTLQFPESIGNLHSLSIIKLQRVEIIKIPHSIGGLLSLTCLSIKDCTSIGKLPDAIGELKSLVKLNLRGTKLSALPKSIGGLLKLQKLDLGSTGIEELPDTVGNLKALVKLDMTGAKLSALPVSIGGLVKLRRLTLTSSEIEELPDAIGDLESLYSLDLTQTKKLSSLPDSIGRLVGLRLMSLASTNVEELPESLRNLKLLKFLDITESALRVLPDFVGDFSRLIDLQLHGCKIRKLPSSIGKLTQLSTLAAAGLETLTEFPKEIANLSILEDLSLTGSLANITRLPSIISQLSHLQHLTIDVRDDSSSEEDVGQSTFQGFENLTDSVTLKFIIDCSFVKCIPQLPSTLSKLELKHVTMETRLPDFSNLKNLKVIIFYSCSGNNELASLQNLKTLKEMTLHSCNEEFIELSSRWKNLFSLTIFEASAEALEFYHSINVTSLLVLDCKGLYEIHGLGKLESLRRFIISRCPKVREIEGLHALFLDRIDIYECYSLRNIDALKKRCRMGYFNGLDVWNDANEDQAFEVD